MSRGLSHHFRLLGTSAALGALIVACGGEPEPKVAPPPPAASSTTPPAPTVTTPPPPKEPTLDERKAKARAAIEASDWAGAKTELDAVVAKKADDVEAQRLLGDVHTRLGNLGGAADAYAAATKADGGKDEPLALTALAALAKQKRWDDTIAVAQLALKTNGKSLPIWLNLGLAQERKGDSAGALDTYGKMTAAFPDEPELWARLALAQAEAGKKDDAKKTAKTATDRWSDARDPKKKKDVKLGAGAQEIAMIARAYRRAGDANAAVAALGKYAIPKDETATEIEVEKGFALRAKKDAKGAEAQAKKALASGGDGYAPAHLLLAGVSLDGKKMDDAKKHLADYKAKVGDDTTFAFDAKEIEAAVK
jgi:Flp pilus assembly protein TadD